MPMFNVNAWVDIDRGPSQSRLIDLVLTDKKFFAANRPAAIVLAESEVVEIAATFDPPYDPADVSISVDQLQAIP